MIQISLIMKHIRVVITFDNTGDTIVNITEHEYEEYKRLKHEEQWRQEAEARQRAYEAERERQHRKDVEHNIEVMRRQGTLRMGEM